MTSGSASHSLPDAVVAWLQAVADTVRERHAQYGDSATDPIRVFSRADVVEQLRVRIDDKLSRVARGAGATPDTLIDLAGYIAILAVTQQRDHAAATAQLPLPRIEDASPPLDSASNATSSQRADRTPLLLPSAMPDDDSYEFRPGEVVSPMMGVRSVDEEVSLASTVEVVPGRQLPWFASERAEKRGLK